MDTTPPVVDSVYIDSTTATPTYTNSATATVYLTTHDVTSGVAGYYYGTTSTFGSATYVPDSIAAGTSGTQITISNVNLGSDGSETVYVWMKDNAGNITPSASPSSATIKVDTTLPAIDSVFIDSTTATPTYTNSATATVYLTTHDVTSGVAGYYYGTTSTFGSATYVADSITAGTSGTQITISNVNLGSDGSETVYVWMKDNAGNITPSASPSSATIKVDTTPPVVDSVYIDSTTATPTYTNSATATVYLTTHDVTSGVAGYYYGTTSTFGSATYVADSIAAGTSGTQITISSVALGSDGPETVYVWMKDNEGNVTPSASPSSATIKVDTTPPVVDSVYIDSTTATPTYTNSATATVYLTTHDVTSGVAGTLRYDEHIWQRDVRS